MVRYLGSLYNLYACSDICDGLQYFNFINGSLRIETDILYNSVYYVIRENMRLNCINDYAVIGSVINL